MPPIFFGIILNMRFFKLIMLERVIIKNEEKIDDIIKSAINHACSGCNTIFHFQILDDIPNFISYHTTIAYLKENYWNLFFNMTEIALKAFKNGAYFNNDDGERYELFKDDNATRNEYDYYYRKLCNIRNVTNSEQARDAFINKNKYDIATNKGVVKGQEYTKTTLRLYETIEFLTVFCLHQAIPPSDKGHNEKRTYYRLQDSNIKEIKYADYEEMVPFFKEIIDCDLTDSNKIESLFKIMANGDQYAYEEILSLYTALTNLDGFNKEILSSQLFKAYLNINLADRFGLEPIKAIAHQLHKIKKRTSQKSRDRFLSDLRHILLFPLLHRRDEYIAWYVDCFKKNTVQEWRNEIDWIWRVISVALNKLREDLKESDYEDLINILNSKDMSYFLPNSKKYHEDDFKSIDFSNILSCLKEDKKQEDEKLKKALDKHLFDLDDYVGFDLDDYVGKAYLEEIYGKDYDIKSIIMETLDDGDLSDVLIGGRSEIEDLLIDLYKNTNGVSNKDILAKNLKSIIEKINDVAIYNAYNRVSIFDNEEDKNVNKNLINILSKEKLDMLLMEFGTEEAVQIFLQFWEDETLKELETILEQKKDDLTEDAGEFELLTKQAINSSFDSAYGLTINSFSKETMDEDDTMKSNSDTIFCGKRVTAMPDFSETVPVVYKEEREVIFMTKEAFQLFSKVYTDKMTDTRINLSQQIDTSKFSSQDLKDIAMRQLDDVAFNAAYEFASSNPSSYIVNANSNILSMCIDKDGLTNIVENPFGLTYSEIKRIFKSK